MKRSIVASLVFCLFVLLAFGVNNLSQFIDVPSFQCVNILSFLFVGITFGFKKLCAAFFNPQNDLLLSIDIFNFYEKTLWLTSIIGTIIGIIIALGNANDLETLGQNLAISLITMLYGIINIALIMPFKMLAEQKQKVIDSNQTTFFT
jgi:H+/Cl- antiporter ClcA